MKTILIATDFSAAAHNATRYGFELSKVLKAKVILFSAYRLPTAHPESLGCLTVTETERLTYASLLKEAEALDPNKNIKLRHMQPLSNDKCNTYSSRGRQCIFNNCRNEKQRQRA